MKTTERIEMTKRNLESVPGYHYNSTKLAEVCELDYIPEGSLVMSQGAEKVYFENGSFVTKNNDQVIRSFPKLILSEILQEQLFCIWAGKQATL